MELYLKITYLNDFIFCPLSIYYHQLYGGLAERLYYNDAQLDGKAVHETIDNQHYSTHKNILQGIDVYSDEYKLCGKIDIFDTKKGLLTERKKHIEKIYDGYLFQLYAQCLCLREMGYKVNEKDFWKNQNQYILTWKHSAKYVEIFIKAIMEYKNEIFIYIQSYYRAFMREKNPEDFPVFNLDGN